jgi:hypothetical protein
MLYHDCSATVQCLLLWSQRDCANDLGSRLYIAMRVSYDTSHDIEATHCVSELEEPENALKLPVRNR